MAPATVSLYSPQAHATSYGQNGSNPDSLNGEYRNLIWENERWWQSNSHIWGLHYPHIATADPNMLAFTESEDKGERDIQTRVRPGRYLKKFFGDILTDKQIAYFANWQATGTRENPWDSLTVEFARTKAEIACVYRHGPYSCMRGPFRNLSAHPCTVYAAGDLAVAYLPRSPTYNGHGHQVTVLARALCWPERKVFGRIYPSPDYHREDGFNDYVECDLAREALRNKLKALGWTSTYEGEDGEDFNGARLLRIEEGNDNFLMPYLDGEYGVRGGRSGEESGYWIMSNDGYDYACNETSGLIDEECEPEPYATCECCQEDIYSEYDCNEEVHVGRHTETWCCNCVDNEAYRCAGSGRYHDSNSNEAVEIGGSEYFMDWALDNGAYRSDFSGDWFFEDDNPAITDDNGDCHATSEDEKWRALHEDESEPTTIQEELSL